eukprot:2006830-Rhodomonas_salina.3
MCPYAAWPVTLVQTAVCPYAVPSTDFAYGATRRYGRLRTSQVLGRSGRLSPARDVRNRDSLWPTLAVLRHDPTQITYALGDVRY